MAILCLADSPADLRARLDRILVGYTGDGQPVLAARDGRDRARWRRSSTRRSCPNLVQSREGTPAFVHGGPFANIAHGCNSVLATRMALAFGDYAVTEAGFAFDLGAEKFFDIKCRSAGLNPSAVVIVATIRALKMHGGLALDAPDHARPRRPSSGAWTTSPPTSTPPRTSASRRSSPSTSSRADTARGAGGRPRLLPSREASPAPPPNVFGQGGEGAIDLAEKVVEAAVGPETPLPAALPARMADREEDRADRHARCTAPTA